MTLSLRERHGHLDQVRPGEKIGQASTPARGTACHQGDHSRSLGCVPTRCDARATGRLVSHRGVAVAGPVAVRPLPERNRPKLIHPPRTSAHRTRPTGLPAAGNRTGLTARFCTPTLCALRQLLIRRLSGLISSLLPASLRSRLPRVRPPHPFGDDLRCAPFRLTWSFPFFSRPAKAR